MPTFNYTGRDANTGKERKGLVEAASQNAAVGLLRGQGLITTNLTEKKEQQFDLDAMWRRLFGVSAKALYTFTRELATMVTSGLPIPQALRILSAQTPSGYFREIIESIIREVEGGSSLSKAMEKYPKVFNIIYLSLIKSGEISGNLDQVLERLSANLEKDREFKGKLKGALIYPTIVLIMMGGVMAMMLIFVIPKLTDMFSSMGVDLPLPTKIMIGMSHFAVNYWWVVIIGGIGLSFAWKAFKKSPQGKHLLDILIFKFPVFGSLSKMSQLAEFTRDLGVLIGSGVPIIDALKISREALENDLLRATVDRAVTSVGRGQTLSSILATDPNFPPLVSQMIQVGEETGRVDKVLLDVAHFFESETDFAVKNLSAAMEPMIMVILGAGVGLMIISIITPIYKLTTSF